MKTFAWLVILVFWTCSFTAVAAEVMRCGTSLVMPGESKLDVLDKCGEPKLKEIISGADEHKVEQWIYKSNDTEFARVLTFIGLRLERVEVLTTR